MDQETLAAVHAAPILSNDSQNLSNMDPCLVINRSRLQYESQNLE